MPLKMKIMIFIFFKNDNQYFIKLSTIIRFQILINQYFVDYILYMMNPISSKINNREVCQ